MNLSLRLLAFTVLAILPIFLVQLVLQADLRANRTSEVRDIALRQAEQANSEIARLTDGIRALLTAVASDPSVLGTDTPQCNTYLARLHARLPQSNALGVFDRDGNVRCWHDDTPPRSNYADRAYFTEPMRTGDFYTGTLIKARSQEGTPVIPFSLPIRDDAGAIVGVAAMSLKADYVQSVVSSWPLPAGGSLTVADRDGVIIARSPLPEKFVGTPIPAAFQSWIRAPKPGVDTVLSQDGTERVLAYVPATIAPSGFYVSSGLSTEAAMALMPRTWTWNGGILAAGLLGSLASALIAGRYLIRKPVHTLIALADAWAVGRPPNAARPLSPREFELVARALDNMARSIEERSSILIAELNHRVKNTLALVQAMGTQTATQTTDPATFNERFGERLRSLARTHDLLTAKHFEAVDLADLLRSELTVIAEAEDRVTIAGPDVEVPAHYAVTLSLITHELATNAVKHGCLHRPGGTLAISWTVEGGPAPVLHLIWAETCAAAIAPPARTGFGSRLIARSMASIGTGRMEFRPSGLVVDLSVPMADWSRPPAALPGPGPQPTGF